MSFSEKEQAFIGALLVNNQLSNKTQLMRSLDEDSSSITDHIETLLSGARMTSDRARFFRNGIEQTELVSAKGMNKHGKTNLYIRNDKLYDQFLMGGTFAMDSIDEFKGYFSSTARQLSERLHCETSANLYVSYGSISGLGYHKDDHHVLVKQLVGQKRWQFGKSQNDIVLNEGDLLFVPKGVAHNPISESHQSFHVTYSIVTPTLSDFLKWACLPEHQARLDNVSAEEHMALNEEIELLHANFLKYRKNKANAFRNYSTKRIFPA
ncbi:cupin domain-containing protein [Vibrio sp. Evd11]|uniref:JmjC domain-containing protein n=1 Tax=Vibrio sp. Evd11 TaxID=1207404 RepID=UPI000EFB9C26|nr:cupin domain-containing protein [Vibrio sp. Evd11]